jgi:hypothetical protein
MVLGWATGIVVLALSSQSAPALTSAAADVLFDDTGSVGSPASSPTWEKSAVPAQTVQAPTAPAQQDSPSGNPLWAIPFTELSSTRERPIFTSSRRPPAPAAAPTQVAKPAPVVPKPKDPERPQLSLVGTVASSQESLGIFLDQSTKAVLRLKTGEYHQGWMLRSVQGREATLEKDQEAVILAFPQSGSQVLGSQVLTSLPSTGKRVSAVSPSWHDRSSH